MSRGNFDYSRHIYSLNCNTEDLVQENGATGSINDDETRDRSPSMISIVSVHHEDIEGYDDGDSDREAVAIEDNQPATNGNTIMNLSLNDPRLTLLRRYLRFQWFPRKVTFAQKAFWTTMQFLIFGFLIFCYALDMGALDHRSLVEEQWEESQETVTAAKNIIWSLRLLEMYTLGVFYFRKRHLEKMLAEVVLTRRYWKKARNTIYKISFLVFLFVFVLPVSSKAVQMTLTTRKAKSFEIKQIVLNLSLSILARVVALPIYFVFIHEVYIIYSHIRLFKEQIQKWPDGMKEEARNRFIDIKVMIRDAERSFQPFLVTHLLLLLVLLIVSTFSCVERFQNESRYQQKYSDLVEMKPAAAIPNDIGGLIFTNFTSFYQKGEVTILLKPSGQNTTTQPRKPMLPPQHTEYETDVNGIVKIACGALADFLEMFVLYSLPLVFLAKLHKIMTSLPEVVQDLKFMEQRENGYLFQNEQILDKMLADLSTGRGIQILRMNLTGIKAALLTLLMPFLTTTIHLLFLHVDLN